MEAALVTGMFSFGVSGANTLSKDVFQKKESNFENIFSKKLNEEKGIQKEKENIKEESKDVPQEKECEKITEDKQDVKETKKKDKKEVKNTKDKNSEETEKINGLAEKLLTEVEDIDLQEVEKLLEVENISLTNEEMLKLQEVLEEKLLQNVVEVGPQNVETEKITFNKYDDLENKLEALQERLGNYDSKVNNTENKIEQIDIEEIQPELNAEKLSSSLESSFDEKSSLRNKDERNKEGKNSITDTYMKGKFDNKVEQLDVEVGEMDSKIADIKMENMSDVAMNKMSNMQEQIDVIKQISEKVDVNLFEDKSEMIIKLKPDHLGKVTVEIAVENGNITAKFLAESEKVKEILESNMQDLKDHLAKQGMMVQDLSVSVGNDNRGPLFDRNNYNSLKKRRKIEEVNSEAYLAEDDLGLSEINLANYWPDSTISFSA